jgi:uncharacterized protein
VKYLDHNIGCNSQTLVGMAHGPLVPVVLERRPDLIDYVEIPYEQLRHAPQSGDIQLSVPAVLHCASMSIAGFVPPAADTLRSINAEARRMRTPWIGEHLAFISADALDRAPVADPVSLTYTVCPQLSEQTVERVAHNMRRLRGEIEVPIIVENAPQYFRMPGSTMSMADFITAVLTRCKIDLLLDLTHFLITCINTSTDPRKEFPRLPLERVVEMHISGISMQSGIAWDDHANPAPELVFELLQIALERSHPRAVTFEYNWATNLPLEIIVRQIGRTRELLSV